MAWKQLSESAPRARCPHKCYLCGDEIEVAEVHVKRTGTSDGEFVEMRMHTRCEELTKTWDSDDWECHDASLFKEYMKRSSN